MNKIMITLAVVLILSSCGTISISETKTDGIPENELSILIIDGNLQVTIFDEEKVKWEDRLLGNQRKVNILPGTHIIGAYYYNFTCLFGTYESGMMYLTHNFEKGKKYLLYTENGEENSIYLRIKEYQED